MDEFLMCPRCFMSPMVLDQRFQDHVVWLCPLCLHRCTPRTFNEEWEKYLLPNILERKKRKIRIITLAVLTLIAILAVTTWKILQ